MNTSKKGHDPSTKPVAENRKARFNYEITETFEAGIQLHGTEVKSLRQGRSNIAEAYAAEYGGEMYLYNAYIPEYLQANQFNHETRRPRKLLMHKREIAKYAGSVQKEGMSLVPLRVFFNARGFAKVLMGLGRGKKTHDKRETEKERSWNREKGRLLREKG